MKKGFRTDRFSSRGKYYRSLDHKAAVLCSAIWNSSNIGNLLVTGCHDKLLRIWDLDSGLCSNILSGHTESVVSICISPSNAMVPIIGSGSIDRTIILWSMESGESLRTLRGHKGVVTSVAISQDLELPVLVSCSTDRYIICWRLSDGHQLGSICGHSGPITSLVLSNIKFPVIVSSGDDKIIKIWDLVSGNLIDSLIGHDSEVNALALSRNPLNPIIVSGSADGKIIVWDLFRLKLKYVLVDSVEPARVDQQVDRSWEVTSVAVADHPHPVILSSTWTSMVRVWDSKSGDLLRILDGVHVRRVSDIRLGQDDAGPVIVTCSHDGFAVVWCPEDDLLVESSEVLSSPEKAAILSLEQSLVIAGKYYCYWSMALQLQLPVAVASGGTGWEAEDEGGASSNSDKTSKAPEVIPPTFRREISPTAAAVIFHSILRLGTINPQLVRVKAHALNFVLGKALSVVDLLGKDSYLRHSPLQFLIENRLCLQRTSEWMKNEINIERIVSTLADSDQSADTLDSILTAVVSNDRLGGWNILLPDNVFEAIFRNLLLNCKRSHKKIAAMLRSHGLEVESEPYSSPLSVTDDKAEIVVRWNQVKKGSGIFCYRVLVNRHLPMDFLLADEFLAAVANSDDVVEFANVPLVQYLIQYKWESWGTGMIFNLGLFYSVYLITTTVAVMAICTGEFVDLTSHLSYVICILISIFCNTIWMGLTLWEWNKSRSHVAFLSNIWNVSDVSMTILCHFCIIIGTITGPITVVRVLSTLLTLLLWSHTLYFGRGQRTLAILIHTMKVIIWDVRFFLFILLLFLLAFAISFRVLGVFATFEESFLRIFNMMFGDLHYDIHFEGHAIATMMYLIFLVSVVIILLNSLIAFMESSFRDATSSRDIAATVSMLRLVTELKVKLFPLLSLHAKVFGAFKKDRAGVNLGDLVVLSPESAKKPDFSPVVSEKELLKKIDLLSLKTHRRVDAISRDVARELHGVDGNVRALEAKMFAIDEKLDHLIHLMSSKQSSETSSQPPRTRQQGTVVSYSYFGEEDNDGDSSLLSNDPTASMK